MFNYLLYAVMPDGAIPGLNDSGNCDVRGLLFKGYKLFPGRQDFLYIATDGERGSLPKYTSYAFPYSGHYVMRTGWTKDALYLLFDSGPFGFGHQHEDKLHFVLYAYGKQHILDPGNYSYDASKWRRYVLSTAGHNTIMVDGQGQNRAATRQTYIWEKPWKEPKPREDDTYWVSTTDYDYVKGTYKDGYGQANDISVAHIRRIFFVKPSFRYQPAYWIIVDTLIPEDQKIHRYEALFHLDANEAKIFDTESKIVRTENKDSSNLFIIPLVPPLDAADLKVEIIKGQEEPVVQGWANHPWRAIPTAIYYKNKAGLTRFVYILYPLRSGETLPIIKIEPLEVIDSEGNTTKEAVAIKTAFKDGSCHYFLQAERAGRHFKFADFSTAAEIAFIKVNPIGKIEAKFEIGDSSLNR